MKIGYPCINLSLNCRSSNTMRLKSFSEKTFLEKAAKNLQCLKEILQFNLNNELLFFRISSDLIPFASHPVNQIKWQKIFRTELTEIGNFIKTNGIRISMHPDQFNVLNSTSEEIVKRSILELLYHCELLDCMELEADAKVQIHVGGVYNDKNASIKRFIQRYKKLPEIIRKRLVIENDERLYSAHDCLEIAEQCSLPVVFDYFHHTLNNHQENLSLLLKEIFSSWRAEDGLPIVDYSSPSSSGSRFGQHARTINSADFLFFLNQIKEFNFDLMLEIKDKEKSALKVREIIKTFGLQLR